MDVLLSSELAEAAGTTTSTVRSYERRGPIAAPKQSRSGYRIYDNAPRSRLLFITRAKQLGLSLALSVFTLAHASSARPVFRY